MLNLLNVARCEQVSRMSGKIVRHLVVFSAWLAMNSTLSGEAQSQTSREYLVKAAYVYRFLHFVEWPPDAFADIQTPITVCIYGQGPLADALESLKGESAQNRSIKIVRVTSREMLQACHVLFISTSEKRRLAQILSSLKPLSVLTIADIKTFARSGGVINFIQIRDKIRFEINEAAAGRAGLKISAKLLNLAKIVTDRN